MQFIDLAAQQQRIRSEIEERIRNILDHGKYIMGPEIPELEKKLAAYTGVRHVLGCASGTDALLMALMAYGIGPGDAVFTTPFTFIATAEVIRLLGAVPVFADIDPLTFNIDPEKLEAAVKALRGEKSDSCPLPGKTEELPTAKGIIAVDLFGLPAEYRSVRSIAQKYDLFLIEDAAQSFGAEYHGTKAGALADIACTSFFPAKPLGCYGDGGALFTDSDELAEKMRSIRVHGSGPHKYDNIRIGINGRLDSIQAAVLLSKLSIFPEEVKLRHQAAQRYSSLLAGIPNLRLPSVPGGMKSIWAQYSLLAENENHRTEIQKKLQEAQIPTAIYYPIPLHLQSAFADLGYRKGDFPISEEFARRIFSIPMHPYLAKESQEKIAEILRTG
ncbi:MAG: DegT/DnrJ/EryC1/StrS family aminotransferase [Desulfococcaceae bacterium]|jgi:dTDP-4-amino-4,6-dideoxygalactose transaminase|nr:DegT/DnrJ/EryC1/StrS family aminotransferase [Desulfococcaceae bacterium]